MLARRAMWLLLSSCVGCTVLAGPWDDLTDGAVVACAPGIDVCDGGIPCRRDLAAHCGACGHACEPGAECVDGMCSPFVIATGMRRPGPFAAGADHLAVATSGAAGDPARRLLNLAVARAPQVSCTLPSCPSADADACCYLSSDVPAGPRKIAAVVFARGLFYWLESEAPGVPGAKVCVAPPTGVRDLDACVELDAGAAPSALAVSSETAAWADATSVDATSPLLEQNGGTASVESLATATSAGLVALGPGYVVFTDGTTLFRKPLDGSSPPAEIVRGEAITSLGATTRYVYWTSADGLSRVAYAEGAPVERLVPAAVAAAIAVHDGGPDPAIDGDVVYWVETGTPCASSMGDPSGDGRVLRWAENALPKVLLLRDQIACPTHVAIDDAYVYWTTGGTIDDAPVGTIARVSR